MNNAKSWVVTVDEKTYVIVYDPSTVSGRKIITINDVPVHLKITSLSGIAGLDQVIGFGGKKANFVLIDGKADIAIDGYFLDSNKPYIPLQGVPKWVWLFVVACIAIPVSTLGGAIPAVIGFLGIAMCIKISVSPKFQATTKVFLCAGATGFAWILLILFVQLVS